ncbi:MAG: PLP-dependent aminotransferase family protein [Spirochaetaceae bacterium]|nr:MAG: PLP-dependent aminotransferase family protein [Spirochaetaceae bacterium]
MNGTNSIRTIQADFSPGMIDLAIGHPSPSLLPLQLVRRSTEQQLATDFTPYLQYGYEPGDGHFRVALAEFLRRHYCLPVSEEELFVSGGVSQALDLLCTVYTKPGDTILVEEPTYFLALRIFADHGLRVISVPIDEQGLVVETLEERLKELRPAFLYTVPAHQNPSGATLSADRRRRLVDLSRDKGFLIVADEVYHLLTYEAQAPAPLAAFISADTVLSLGSFSKILAPGLRLGWIQTCPRLWRPLAECGMLDSGGGLNPFTSALVRSALETGALDAHLGQLRREYGRRLQAMKTAIDGELSGKVEYSPPNGGFFFWLRLIDGGDSGALLTRAKEKKTSFVPGSAFSAVGQLQDRLRLSFSYHPPEVLQEGVRRLQESLSENPPIL